VQTGLRVGIDLQGKHREERKMAKAKEPRDRVALITGAGSGIGLATVERVLVGGW
jgi:hypothetical protein